MLIELGAVADHGTVKVLIEQTQTLDQGMNRPQHRPGDVVGIDLITAHHQQRRTSLRIGFVGQQLIDAEQAIGCRMMGLAAGAVEQLVDPRTHDEVCAGSAGIKQVRCPLSHTDGVIDQQVVIDKRVAGQGAFKLDIDQMHERMTAYGNDRAFLRVERDISYTLQAQGQRQFTRAHQPQHHARRLQPPQQRAGQYRRQRDQVIGCWKH